VSTSSAEPLTLPPTATDEDAGAAPSCLIVDDEPHLRRVLVRLMQSDGFACREAGSGVEALARLDEAPASLVLTDLHMPDPGDGFTVVTAMRHSQPDALTLLVSGYPDVQCAMAAILLEADEIIVKPFDVGRLGELVRDKMLARRPAARLGKDRVSVILRRCLNSSSKGVGACKTE